jgi:hypothetical protein
MIWETATEIRNDEVRSDAGELLDDAAALSDGVVADGHGLVVRLVVLDVDVDNLHPLAGEVVGAVERDDLGRVGRAVDVLEDDVGDGDLGRAGLDADVVGAVLLVDDDGEGDVVHGDAVVEELGRLERGLGVLVGLDAEAVGGADDDGVGDGHVLDVLLVLVASQAADADAVAGAAARALDADGLGPGADGDAVVAGGDGGVPDGDVDGVADVDAVRVGAVAGRLDAHLVHQHVLALEDVHVEELAVEQRDAADLGAGHVVQHQAVGQDLAVVVVVALVAVPHQRALPVDGAVPVDGEVGHVHDLDPVLLVRVEVARAQQVAVQPDDDGAVAGARQVQRARQEVAPRDQDLLRPRRLARVLPRLHDRLRAVRLAVAFGAQLRDVQRARGHRRRRHRVRQRRRNKQRRRHQCRYRGNVIAESHNFVLLRRRRSG